MNAPHFDVKKVHSQPFGSVAWMDAVIAEEKRCCGQIDNRVGARDWTPNRHLDFCLSARRHRAARILPTLRGLD
jgi:hypothetical protein